LVFEQGRAWMPLPARVDAAAGITVATEYRPNTTETEKFHRS
jgi:hypothetical protein